METLNNDIEGRGRDKGMGVVLLETFVLTDEQLGINGGRWLGIENRILEMEVLVEKVVIGVPGQMIRTTERVSCLGWKLRHWEQMDGE